MLPREALRALLLLAAAWQLDALGEADVQPGGHPATCAIASCTTCSKSGKACAVCKRGFFNSRGKCARCSTAPTLGSSCRQCNQQGTACTRCGQGFFVKAGRCAACSSSAALGRNCVACSQNGTVCTACQAGFFMKGGKCTPCSSALPNCKACNSRGSACTACPPGFSLAPGGLACGKPCNMPNCMWCSAGNRCEACREGYSAVDNFSRCSIPACTFRLDRASSTSVGSGSRAAINSNCAEGLAGASLQLAAPFSRAAGCGTGPLNPYRDSGGLRLAPGAACSSIGLPAGYQLTAPQKATLTIRSLIVRDWALRAPPPFTLRFSPPLGSGRPVDVVVPAGAAKGSTWSLPGSGFAIPPADGGLAAGGKGGAASGGAAAAAGKYTLELVRAQPSAGPTAAWVSIQAILGDVVRLPSCGPPLNQTFLDGGEVPGAAPSVVASLADCCGLCGRTQGCGAFTFLAIRAQAPRGLCLLRRTAGWEAVAASPYDPSFFAAPVSSVLEHDAPLEPIDVSAAVGQQLRLACASGTVDAVLDAAFGSLTDNCWAGQAASKVRALCAGKGLSTCVVPCTNAALGADNCPSTSRRLCVATFTCRET